ncbi:MAG: lipopolysaccharide biosynthesis protein [Cohaesibacteraceae bacterium]
MGKWAATLKRAGWNTVDQATTGLLSLAALAAIARLGSLETAGLFAALWALSGLQTSLVGWGMGTLFFARTARGRQPPQPFHRAATGLTALSLLVLYIATWAAIALLAAPSIDGPSPSMLYALIGLRMTLALTDPHRMVALARGNARSIVARRLVTGTLAALGLLACVHFDLPVHLVAAILGLEAVLFALLTLQQTGQTGARRNARPAIRRLKRLAAAGLPLLAHTMAIAVYVRFDVIYVAWRFRTTDAALYAGAARLAEAGNLLALIAALAITPLLIETRAIASSLPFRRQASQTLLASASLSILGAGFATLVGSTVLGFLFTPTYAEATNILSVYALSTGFVALGTIATRILVAESRLTRPFQASLVGAGGNIALTVILCQIMGPLGAALATVLSYALVAAMLWHALLQERS